MIFVPKPVQAVTGTAAFLFALPVVGEMTSADVDRAVEEVFSDPAFREGLEGSHSGAGSLLVFLVEAIQRLFARILENFSGLQASSPLLFWLLFTVLVIVLLALLTHIVWTLAMVFRGAGGTEGGEEEAVSQERARRFAELRSHAHELAVRGRFREAAHHLLLALLSLVEERNVLKLARGWTNREVLDRLRARGTADELELFGGAVEKAWYGGEAVSRHDYGQLAEVLDRIAPAVVTRPPLLSTHRVS